MSLGSYRDLIVWQKSIELTKEIYTATSKLPAPERYGLVAQMRRAAVSIPSNIAEGSKRGSRRDFRSFLLNASGSGAELQTQITIVIKLSLGQSDDYRVASQFLDEIMRMLHRMVKSLAHEAVPATPSSEKHVYKL